MFVSQNTMAISTMFYLIFVGINETISGFYTFFLSEITPYIKLFIDLLKQMKGFVIDKASKHAKGRLVGLSHQETY